MDIKFYKMTAAGNDFIVVDNRQGNLRGLARLAREVCPRRIAVGADGILAMEKSKSQDVRMRIYNADGSEAEMCGNGARCAALFCHEKLGFGREFVMETLAGPIAAKIGKASIRVGLTDPTDFRDLAPLEVEDGIYFFYFINTGVPHTIVFQESLDTVDVDKIGRQIRTHKHFQPKGTNVNFVEILSPSLVKVRTFERGVEGETLACGTGATAAGIVSVLIGKCKVPVGVQTASGEVLKVSFESNRFEVQNVFLEGKARFVYEGKLQTKR